MNLINPDGADSHSTGQNFNEQVQKSCEASAAMQARLTLPVADTVAETVRRITAPGVLSIVAALTGRGKSNFICNAVALALTEKSGPVGLLLLEPDIERFSARIAAIISGLPVDRVKTPWNLNAEETRLLEEAKAQMNGRLRIATLYKDGPSLWPKKILALVAQLRLAGASFVALDGLESLSHGNSHAQQMEVLLEGLSLEAAQDLAVMTTSQTTRESATMQIVTLGMLSHTSVKTNVPQVVVTIGAPLEETTDSVSEERSFQSIHTLVIAKDRDKLISNLPQVQQVALLPSLRYTTMPTLGSCAIGRPRGTEEMFAFHGPEADQRALEALLENAGEISRTEGDAQAVHRDEDCDQDIGATGAAPARLKPFHGTEGFVQMGRGITAAPLYANGDLPAIGLLTVLYMDAQFDDHTLYAPSTKCAVALRRGELMTSTRMLVKRLGITESKVRGYLDRFVREDLIEMHHVLSNGERVPVPRTSERTTNHTTGKKLCTVIKLKHYANYEKPDDAGRVPGSHTKSHADSHNDNTSSTRRSRTTEQMPISNNKS